VRLFLEPLDYPRWSACAGSSALIENEPQTPDVVPDVAAERLDLSPITGEKGALFWAQVYIEASTLKVTPEDRIVALAALHKYELLTEFTDTNVGTVEELSQLWETVRTQAALALELRNNVAALSQLTPGPYCRTCPCAYRCPALERDIHEEVFGELQPVDEHEPTIIEARSRVESPEELPAYLERVYAKLPLIEHWVRQIKAHRALLKGKNPKLPKIKKRKRRKLKRGSTPPSSGKSPPLA
jgi:hypothetical protein